MDNYLKKDAAQFKDILSREVVLRTPSINEEDRAIRGIIATEQPVIVMDWYRWEPVREVLMMDGANIPDKVPLLDTHSRFEVSNIKGSTTRFDYENDSVLGLIITGDNIFSKTAETEYTLAKEGHLDSTSIGYRVYDSESVSIPYGQQMEINGRVFKNDYPDKLPLVIRKKWDLLENSLVPIGADKAAKFRSMFAGEPKSLVEEIKEANENLKNNLTLIKIKGEMVQMDEEKKVQEEQRTKAIDVLVEKFQGKVKGVNLKEVGELYKTGNKSEKDFSDYILQSMQDQKPINAGGLDLSKKEKRVYSVARAMRSLLTGENCFEKEVSAELAKRFGRPSGIYIPHSAFDLKRDLLAGAADEGEQLVGTDHLAGEFIELLRNKMLTSQLGVRILSGLQGNVEIPKWSAAATFGWAATEAGQISESTPGTTELTLSPKRGGAYVEASKTLLIQSSPSADALIQDDLVKVIALAVDKAILEGTGSSGQPTGIAATSGIGSVTGAGIDWAKVLEFQSDVETANADAASMYYVTTPAIRALLKSRAKETGYPVYLCGDDNTMAGYPVMVTNQMTAASMLFGDFSQAILGMWGALDITVDPYTKADYGLVRFIAQQLVDVAVRQPGAFSLATLIS